MKLHYTSLVFIGFLCLLISNACTKNPFEQVVDVKLPEEPVSLVASLSINNYYSPILKLSKTNAPLANQNNYDTIIPNATVEMFENGVSKGLMTAPVNAQGLATDFYKMVNPFVPVAGNEYAIKVSGTAYQDVSAQDVLPSLVPITVSKTGKIKTVTNQWSTSEVDTFVEIKVQFTDPTAPGDYYKLLISEDFSDSTGNTYGNQNWNQIISTDIIFGKARQLQGPFGGSLGENFIDLSNYYFDDEFFNGTSKEALLYIAKANLFGSGFTEPYIYLQHVSEANYRFNTSYQAYLQNEGNPFSQPVILFSNVKGGFGIMQSNAVSIARLKL